MAAVAAIDDGTVSVQLRSSNAGLPWVLSGLPFSVIGQDGAPTGDFEITSDDSNGLILGRRAARVDESVPSTDRVVVTWADDSMVATQLLSDSIVDAAIAESLGDPISQRIGGVAGADQSDQPDRADQSGKPAAVPTAATRFYVLNLRSEALADIQTRRAVLAAIDRPALVAASPEQSLVLADGLVPSTMAGFRSGACDLFCGNSLEYGAGARPDALQLSYAGEEQRATAATIVEQLTAAGIQAEQNELDPEDLATVIVDGETDVFSFGWVAAATSSDAIIPPLLAVESPANVARVDSPVVADLLERAAVTADDELRWEILDRAHRGALSEALILPVAGSVSMLQQRPDYRPVVERADGSIDLDWRG
jgi:ABC-type transport system substrate-binding protein